ncbi:MAG: hypothetical protein LUF87_03800 [Alistipes sp.]|nr:hypothetical protein [Alistipes sp.]
MNRLSEQEEEPDGNPTGYQGTPNIQKGDNIYRSTGPYWPGGGIDPRAFSGYNPDLENIEDIYEAIQTGNTILSIINDYGLEDFFSKKVTNPIKNFSRGLATVDMVYKINHINQKGWSNLAVEDVFSLMGATLSTLTLLAPITLYTDYVPKQGYKTIRKIELSLRDQVQKKLYEYMWYF